MKEFLDIKYGNEPLQMLDVYIPDCESFPVFVYFHGGGIEAGEKENFFIPYLVEKGVAVVSANYRMYPDAKYPEFIEDAAAAVAWAKENIYGYGNVSAFMVGGSSAGGYISQMLCFNKEYLAKHNLSLKDIDGFYHDAGQPTCHFNVLRERGIDSRRVIIDEYAPLYYVDDSVEYPPMEIVVSDNDMENRYEQLTLLVSTIKHFGHDMSKVTLTLCENSLHNEYLEKVNPDGSSVFAEMVYKFISRVMESKK